LVVSASVVALRTVTAHAGFRGGAALRSVLNTPTYLGMKRTRFANVCTTLDGDKARAIG
jgi:hypothetical protein